MPEYLIILIGFLILSLSLQKYFQVTVFSNIKQALVFFLILYLIAMPWDYVAVIRGHWNYPGPGILG